MGATEETFADVITERLKSLQTNAYAVEKKAGLPLDAVRNVIRSTKRSGPTLSRTAEICDALGLELYIGPKRVPEKTALDGFAERAAEYIHSVDGSPEALKEGFLPIPYSSYDPKHAKDGFSPLAFSRNWIIGNGLHPDNLSVIETMNNRMAPLIRAGSLVMVDTAPSSKDNQVWAFLENGKLDIARLNFLDGNGMVVIRDHPDEKPQLIDHNKLTSIAPIGRIIWTGFNLSDE